MTTTKIIELILFVMLFVVSFAFLYILWSGVKFLCDGVLDWRLSDYVITTIVTGCFVMSTYNNYRKIQKENI